MAQSAEPIQAGSHGFVRNLSQMARTKALDHLAGEKPDLVNAAFQALAIEGDRLVAQARSHSQAASFADLVAFARAARLEPCSDALFLLAEEMSPLIQHMASGIGLETSRAASAAVAACYWIPTLGLGSAHDLLRREALALRHAQPDPVYVDEAIHAWRGKLWAHMFSEDIVELHAFAKRLGASRQWFQQPPNASWKHYDISEGKRWQAIRLGAVSTDRYTALEISLKIAGRLTPEKSLSLAKLRDRKAEMPAQAQRSLL